MSVMVSFVLSFFPRDVLDEILNLIGSVSEGYPSYSYMQTVFNHEFSQYRPTGICNNFHAEHALSISVPYCSP